MSFIAATAAMAPLKADGGDTLRRRVLSAAVLAPLALAAVWFGGLAFLALILLAAVLLAWEWNGISGGGILTLAVHGIAAVAAVALVYLNSAGWSLLAVAAGAVAAGIVGFATRSGPKWPSLGVVYLTLPCIALVWLRADPALGRETILWLLAVVWATDIGAYFAGRGIGGPKLWPRVSPKKTWSGLLGGATAAAAVSAAVAFAFGLGGVVVLALVGAVLAVVSQVGDLTESGFKRHFGVKDSSHLIPGHGGVMDRVDGLLIAVPVYALFVLVAGGTTAWS
ncbi:MAG: phosphatidate cytidylyltransferase [Minwuiales bacterium]|nr:phosphatidate cytidylyltransferase [Minwuiales bacterium]